MGGQPQRRQVSITIFDLPIIFDAFPWSWISLDVEDYRFVP